LNPEAPRTDPARDPYAPPRAPLVAARAALPRPVRWALTALWLACALTLLNGVAADAGHGALSWPPTLPLWKQITLAACYAWLILRLARGRLATLLLYALLLALLTVMAAWRLPNSWAYSPALACLTVSSLVLQYLAMYWMFTLPGRRWFTAPRA
jgi:hypothetical protein